MDIKSNLDQPDPIKNEHDALWPQVISDLQDSDSDVPIKLDDATLKLIAAMQERHEVGIKRYGTPLQPFNGRDALTDGFQEILDAIVYIKQYMVEHADPKRRQVRYVIAETMYNNLIDMALLIVDIQNQGESK